MADWWISGPYSRGLDKNDPFQRRPDAIPLTLTDLFLSLIHHKLDDVAAAARCYDLALQAKHVITGEPATELERLREFVAARVKP